MNKRIKKKKLKQIINIFKETHYKMKDIKIEQKKVNQYSNINEILKELYKNEDDIEIKKLSLYIQQNILNIAKYHNDKVGQLLDDFDTHTKDKQYEISHIFDKKECK